MPKHRGISAAEKYAELEKAGASRPRCSCHGEEKVWQKDARKLAGGVWACATGRLESNRIWREANREKDREATRRWREANYERVCEVSRRQKEKRRADPEYRKLMTLYQLHYRHRKKKERYGNEGLTLGNHGQEDGSGGDRAAA